MEGVDAVLGQKLPVGVDDVLLAAAHDLHLGFALVGDQVDIFLGARQVVAERHGIAVEIDEPEIAVAFEPRHLHEVGAAAAVVLLAVVALLEARGKAAVHVERPAVIEAAERQRIALLFAHHHRAAVRAGVEEGVHGPAAIAVEDELAAADGAGDEVAVVADLRAMAEIEPAPVEDLPPLLLEHLFVGKGAPGDAEQVPLAILDDHVRIGQGQSRIRHGDVHRFLHPSAGRAFI